MDWTHEKINRVLAGLVFATVFLVYLPHIAPTVSFWDCGEYASVCQSLEVPHPPGNPLYIMVGRVSSMLLFFVKDYAWRITVLSPFTMAIVAMLLYLTIVRVLTGAWGTLDTMGKRISAYLGGTTGALLAAFANTNAFNTVEAEVNTIQLLPVALCTWLAIVWAQSKSPKRDRLLVLISYISFLGIGIHMMSMITLIPVFLFVVFSDRDKLTNIPFWITCIVCGLVIYSTSWFIVAGPLAAATAGVAALLLYASKSAQARRWALCFWIAFSGIIGFSCHLYLPIRSALNPVIDENHPATYQSFIDYLERKQYGQGSMIGRMFWRRGTLAHQFGIEGNMGFGGFWLTQFYKFSPLDTENDPQTGKPYLFTRNGMGMGMLQLLVYLVPTLIMFFGWYHLWRRHRQSAILLIFLLLATTIVIVLYMNFADGLRSEYRDYQNWVRSGRPGPEPLVHREVRVRDYFWAPGFMFYGMWVGMGLAALLYTAFTTRITVIRRGIAAPLAVLVAISPALAASQSLGQQSRRGVFAPFDYAYNLLMSCDRDAVLFTNGDNDTFPLWALQEAYGIRRDVRIVNLSLVNTDWYILQLKNLEPKVPISYSNKEIARLNHGYNSFKNDVPYTLPGTDISVMLPGQKKLNVIRIQDQMVLNIVGAARANSPTWKKPVYFAVTVSNDNFMGLEPYLRMEGLVYRMMDKPVAPDERIDLGRTLYMLDKVYKFRGLGDGSAILDETTQKLLSNYAASYIQVAYSLRDPLGRLQEEVDALSKLPADKDSAGAKIGTMLAARKADLQAKLDLVIGKLDECVGLMPWDWRPRALRHEFLVRFNRADEAERRMREALSVDPENVDYLKMLAQALEMGNKKTESNDVLRRIIKLDKDPWYAYMALARNYEDAAQFDSAIGLLKDYQDSHPGDRRSANLIAHYENLKAQKAAPQPLADSAKKPAAGQPKSAKKG